MAQPPLHVLVEIPKGSRNKYEWDEDLQAIKLDRFLFSSVVYPTDYGFIPEALGEDGDPLDAMGRVTPPTTPGRAGRAGGLGGDGDPRDAMGCGTEPTFPGCVIPAQVVALFRMRDEKGVDDKV